MYHIDFNIEKPISYHYTGKFQAPDNNWIHLSRVLNDFELIVVTEGTLYLLDNDTKYEIQKGQYFIQAPGVRQKGYQPSECSFYWLHFSPYQHQMLDSFVYNQNNDKSHITLPNFGFIRNVDKVILFMKQLQDSIRSYTNAITYSYLTTVILCELFNQMNSFSFLKSENTSRISMLNDILDYIHSHLNENITVSQLADVFRYNEKYLSTFFHKSAGIPLKQYIIKEKMDAAKGMLNDTTKSISEIGYSLGFTDSHNFSKAFKKQVGITPTKYRNTYANRMLFYK